MNAPIDRTHADCVIERDRIRAHVAIIRARINAWTPKPYPKESTR